MDTQQLKDLIRIIRDALEDNVIKEDDPESKSRKFASYLPFWA